MISFVRKPKRDYHSHWSQLLPNFKFSTQEFYSLLKDEMQSHEIKDVEYEDIQQKIGSILSAERLYLRIRWEGLSYDICFAPFGDGCFVSWWLYFETTDAEIIFTNIPFIGNWIDKGFYRKTMYQIDIAGAYMAYAHNSALAVIDQITKKEGIRIEDFDRKPVMNNIYTR